MEPQITFDPNQHGALTLAPHGPQPLNNVVHYS